MSQIPGNTNRNDATFRTTADAARASSGGIAGRARRALRDSNNDSRDIMDGGENAEYPRISNAPNSGLPDSNNPRGY